MSGGGGASGAAAAGGGVAAGGDAGVQGEATNGGPDYAAMTAQLSAMSESQEQIRQYLQSHPALQQQEAGEPDADLDLSYLDDDDDDGFDADPNGFDAAGDEALQEATEAITNATDGMVQAAVAPLANEIAEMRRMTAMRDLVEQYPDLGEDADLADFVVRASHSLAQAHGHPELAAEPWFWGLTYAAHKAHEAALEEGEGDAQAAHLEGGAGAASAGGQQGDETTRMIAEATKSRPRLPFP